MTENELRNHKVGDKIYFPKFEGPSNSIKECAVGWTGTIVQFTTILGHFGAIVTFESHPEIKGWRIPCRPEELESVEGDIEDLYKKQRDANLASLF